MLQFVRFGTGGLVRDTSRRPTSFGLLQCFSRELTLSSWLLVFIRRQPLSTDVTDIMTLGHQLDCSARRGWYAHPMTICCGARVRQAVASEWRFRQSAFQSQR